MVVYVYFIGNNWLKSQQFGEKNAILLVEKSGWMVIAALELCKILIFMRLLVYGHSKAGEFQ
jgi:hypothetical protein